MAELAFFTATVRNSPQVFEFLLIGSLDPTLACAVSGHIVGRFSSVTKATIALVMITIMMIEIYRSIERFPEAAGAPSSEILILASEAGLFESQASQEI
jgi:hypothetical protein